MSEIKVSVLCVTYNHAKFIRRALEGIVSQQTDFAFEAIVHDDASTDGTADIVREFAERFPGIVVPIFQTENQYTRGGCIARRFLWPRIRGKYVAFCEGDDYWTDPQKLQFQVDWLDAHPDSGLCFHYATMHWENGERPDSIYPDEKMVMEGPFTFERLLKRNFIQTSSVMYKWRLKGHEDSVPRGIAPGDWYKHLLHAEGGEIGFIPRAMSVYRRHAGGIWWGSDSRDDAFCLRNGLRHLGFYKAVRERFGYDNRLAATEMARNTILSALRAHRFDLLGDLASAFPESFDAGLVDISKDTERIDSAAKTAKRASRHLRRFRNLSILLAVLLALAVAALLA